MFIKYFLFLVFLISGSYAHAKDAMVDAWLDSYDAILEKYVVEGKKKGIMSSLVNYEGLRHDPAFRKLVRDLARLPAFDALLPREQMAMWINAYNCLVLKIVVNHPDIQSLQDLSNESECIWKQKIGVVARHRYSLDEIEHALLRPKFHDPRIHFVLTCGTLSSPDLARKAYRGDQIEEQLQQQTSLFLRNPTKGLRTSSYELQISSIFKWYPSDFKHDLQNWLKERKLLPLELSIHTISFFDYNWELNSPTN